MDGTTDVTRTIALGEVTQEEKEAFTTVLKGHLNLAAAHFPYGVCGQNLDVLAREPLWEQGLDFNHGTGHGVGYLLSVHEGPQNFRWRMKDAAYVPLEEGMVISNEPGLYLTGKFGIRHENLMLCRKGEKNEYGQFMYLEPLTMVPFDRDAIDPQLLTERELMLLNEYHKKVYETLSPYLEGEVLQWLRTATLELIKNNDK
jgi:Xaa-Pro aminopeptidase